MSQCSPCNATTPLPMCMANLTLGTYATPSTALYVYVENLTTKILTRFSVTAAAGTGNIVLDLTSFPQIPGHIYSFWATLATATNLEETVTITNNAVNYTCFEITFEPVYDDTQALITGLNQTLKPTA